MIMNNKHLHSLYLFYFIKLFILLVTAQFTKNNLKHYQIAKFTELKEDPKSGCPNRGSTGSIGSCVIGVFTGYIS